jgi:hypothetical protein
LKGTDMSMFFPSDFDPSDVAAMLVSSALDCVPSGSDALDTFIGEISTRFESAGGIEGFAGDAVQLSEDAGIALDMAVQVTDDEAVREIAAMSLMALDEARASSAWTADAAWNMALR